MCSSIVATAPPPVPVNPSTSTGTACPKCGTTRKGKVSCCAKGGTWFNKCGDPGDTNFEHEWDDGIDACKGERTLDCVQGKDNHVCLLRAK